MSADLLAAFGISESNQQPNETIRKVSDVTKPTTMAKPSGEQPWILQSRPITNLAADEPNKPLWKQDEKGTDVLFDASDSEAEDDFGDFEQAQDVTKGNAATQPDQQLRQQTHPQQPATTDLLGLDDFLDMQISQSSKNAPKSVNNNNLVNDSRENQPLAPAKPERSAHFETQATDTENASPVIAPNNQQREPEQWSTFYDGEAEDEDWCGFEEIEAEERAAVAASATSHTSHAVQSKQEDKIPDEEEWGAFEDSPLPSTSHAQSSAAASLSKNVHSTPTPPTSTSNPRPTNIPPPSTLLQLLPKLYQYLSQQSRLPTSVSTLPHLILQVYITSARIISGRGHRWKRDAFLSQSTRISQAGLKNTGMKLTALDKSETIKEDQEAQEAVASWQRHAAILNAVLLKAKVQKPPMSLSANMTVRVGGGAGVISAKECCAICGLKRNERVTGIDVKVEDSFGEFWVEHWGHKDCYEFWYQYEGMLDKR